MAYGLDEPSLTPLRHEHNTTFRVRSGDLDAVLRIHRPGVHAPGAIRAEVDWLIALRDDTGLGVPQALAALDGSPVVEASDPDVPEPRDCVVFRWLDGRFHDAGLAPSHLRAVAALQAGLQEHTLDWVPPATFARARVDNLTTVTSRLGVHASAVAATRAHHPSTDDADRATQLVADLVSAADAATFAAAVEVVRATTGELAAQPDTFGLIHGDLHQENYLFHDGAARAIDFDDCGWGFYLYDLAVTVSELGHLDRRNELRAALLDEYAHRRGLPENHERHLRAFIMLRVMQLVMWAIESRQHAAFRDDWQASVREDLDWLAAALDAARDSATR